jgi:hypothetical protein
MKNFFKRLFGGKEKSEVILSAPTQKYCVIDDFVLKVQTDESHFETKHLGLYPETQITNQTGIGNIVIFLKKQNKKQNIYPKWKHLITKPTIEEYEKIFKSKFDFYPNVCSIEKYDDDFYYITTPKTEMYMSATVNYTETPMTNKIYYEGCGCTFDVDSNGDRFHLIDFRTNLPYKWDEIYSDEIVYKYVEWYLNCKKNIIRENKLKRILE